MEQIKLRATERNLLGKRVKVLRGKNEIPAVLYGRKFPSIALTLPKSELLKVIGIAGESTIINLDVVDKEKYKALIRGVQKDPISDNILHVDFYKIDMKQEIQTEIPLRFTGFAPAVEELEGNFITNKDSIKVECLPDKLVGEIEVDISVLKTFEDLIHVTDLTIPEGIKVLEEPDDIVAQVTPPLSEEELKKIEEEAAATTEKAQIENIEAEAEKEKVGREVETAEEEKPSAPQEQETQASKNE